MSTHVCFYGELTKIILHLLSNTLLLRFTDAEYLIGTDKEGIWG